LNNWFFEFMWLEFRNFVTLLIVGILIGGSGVTIIYDSTFKTLDVKSETILSNRTTELVYTERTSLGESQPFNIWLGSILGYGGAVIGTLYKAKNGNGNDW